MNPLIITIMKTASVFLRTAIIGAIIGNVFLARNIVNINKDPWLPLNDDANKRHDTNDKNKEDENKFSNRQSFSDDYDAEEYKDILKHLQLYKGKDNDQNIFVSSTKSKKPSKRYPNRKVINILPKVVEKEDVVSMLQWLSGAERTLGQALRPVTSALSTVLHSLSLDSLAGAGTDRQATIPAVDSLVDTAQFAVDQLITSVQENPDPPLVLSTLFLSLVTGNFLGNSISDKVSKAEKDKKDKEKEKEKEKKKKRKKKDKDKEMDKEKEDDSEEDDDDDEEEDKKFPILDDGPSIDNCPIGYELVYVQDCYIYQLSKSRSFPFEIPGFGSSCPKDGYYCRDPFEAANAFLGGGGGDGGGGGGDGVGVVGKEEE